MTSYSGRRLAALDRDRLNMLPRDRAAGLAHKVLAPLNRLEGEDLVAAVAILFAAVTTRTRMDPQEAHLLGMRIMREQQGHRQANDSLQALRDFAGIQGARETDVEIM